MTGMTKTVRESKRSTIRRTLNNPVIQKLRILPVSLHTEKKVGRQLVLSGSSSYSGEESYLIDQLINNLLKIKMEELN